MKMLKNLKYILILSAIILVMMIIKVRDNNTWPGNAGKAAEILAFRTSFITMEDLKNVAGPVTLIRPGRPDSGTMLLSFPVVNASWEDIVKKEFLGKINQPDHKYIIVSGSFTDRVKAWVLLNQVGVKDLYVLDQEGMNNELFKYQFQPDTTIKLELENTEER